MSRDPIRSLNSVLDPSDDLLDRPVKRVCCWCDPARAAVLSVEGPERVQFGMCDDCLDTRLSVLRRDGRVLAPLTLQFAR